IQVQPVVEIRAEVEKLARDRPGKTNFAGVIRFDGDGAGSIGDGQVRLGLSQASRLDGANKRALPAQVSGKTAAQKTIEGRHTQRIVKPDLIRADRDLFDRLPEMQGEDGRCDADKWIVALHEEKPVRRHAKIIAVRQKVSGIATMKPGIALRRKGIDYDVFSTKPAGGASQPVTAQTAQRAMLARQPVERLRQRRVRLFKCRSVDVRQ